MNDNFECKTYPSLEAKYCLETQFEKCVVCNMKTDFTKDTSINYRKYYVPGVGQVCKECFQNIFKKDF